MNPYKFNSDNAAQVCEYLTSYEIKCNNIYERFGAACGLLASMAEKIGGLWLFGYDTTNDRDALTFAASQLFTKAETEAKAIYEAVKTEWGEENARVELDRRQAIILDYYEKIMHFVNDETNHINANNHNEEQTNAQPAETAEAVEVVDTLTENENRTTAIINRVKEFAQALAVRATQGWQFVKACAVGLFGWSFVLLIIASLLSLPYFLYLIGAEVANAPEMITAGQWVVLFLCLCVMSGGGFAGTYILREIYKNGI